MPTVSRLEGGHRHATAPSGALQHLGLVDQDAPGTRGGLEHGRHQGAGPAGDVGDRA
jgi:hypothetical protein